jgi:hypothetical protein
MHHVPHSHYSRSNHHLFHIEGGSPTHSAPKTNAEVTNPSSLEAVYPTKKKSLCSRADKDMEELPGKGTEDHTR